MRLKIIKPSRRRAKALGTALGALGTAFGALPVTIRPKRRKGVPAVKIAVPITVAAALIAAVSRRRRAAAEYANAPGTGGAERWSASVAPAESVEPTMETEREKDRETIGDANAETAHPAAGETPAATEAGQSSGNGSDA
jgi:hypothetical protein